MESLEHVREILRPRGDMTLSKLLGRANVEFESSGQFGSHWFSDLTTAEIHAPFADYEELLSLSPDEENRILAAMLEIWPPKEHEMELNRIVFRVDPVSLDEPIEPLPALSEELDWLSQTLIEVATGGPRIDSVNPEYKRRFAALSEELSAREVQNPIPFDDLWRWYSKWSSGELPTYRSRRDYIHGLVDPLKRLLGESNSWTGTVAIKEPTGWALVDRQMDSVRKRLKLAAREEDFQALGLICRETLISLGQAVYDPELHKAPSGVRISKTDSKGMLDSYLSVALPGPSNEVARKYARAAVDLANGLQHRRSATHQHAVMCAEATASVVGFFAAAAGLRSPETESDGPTR
ncbi:MAG: hypothetical protein OXD50_01090 [Chloroflexi bacterium]|nr:hypothetical protein [Chloroflexota bacterium]